MENSMFLGPKVEIMQISLDDSKTVMERGLKYFLGEKYKWLPSYDKIAEWLSDNKKKGLMLYGGNGLGKTIMCTKVIPAILKYYLCIDYYYVDAMNLGDYYRNSIENLKITVYNNPFIIDDFGVESVINEYGEKHDLFSEIVDRSEKNGRLLILTTNLTPKEIGDRYGARTLDRLKGITKAIKVDGKSMRG